MNRLSGLLLLWLMLATALFGRLPHAAWAGESLAQERLAYFELNRIRLLSKPGVTYNNYRDALVRAREYVSLLRDGSSATVGLLRNVMSYYEQALAVWKLEADSEFPVDSLRSDEPNGADILRQCPGISRFHYKERDQIYVKDVVDCLWRTAADLLDVAPADLR